MIKKLARLCILLLIGLGGAAHASFHLWKITEIGDDDRVGGMVSANEIH